MGSKENNRMRESRRSAGRGFTLLELMIAVVVLAVLTGIAYPAYEDQMRKSRRADGQGPLVELANLQQQFFSDNPGVGFAPSLAAGLPTAALYGGNGYPTTTPGGHYTLAIEAPTAECPIARCFVVSATAVATGGQMGDLNCRVMSLSNTGAKTSKNSSSAASDGCWRK